MRRYVVRGTVTLEVRTVVDAVSEHQAVEEATCAVTADRIGTLGGSTDLLVKAAHMGAFEVPGVR